MFIKQDPMRRVTVSLVPLFLWSTYLYGWRVVALTGIVFLAGILTEFIFEKSRNKKVSEAVLVTCGLFALSLPPAVPFWVAIVGIVFAVIFGKEVYGGFGRNVYNPAIAGRTFTYISFPLLMQTTWMLPGMFGMGGVNRQAIGSNWIEALFMIAVIVAVYLILVRSPGQNRKIFWVVSIATVLIVAYYIASSYIYAAIGNHFPNEIDVIATATPLEIAKGLGANWHPKDGYEYLQDNSLLNLFFGFRIGSIGESGIFLIVLAGIYLLATKTANWRPMLWTFLSAFILSAILYYSNVLGGTPEHPGRFVQYMVKPDLAGQISDLLKFVMSGALIFGAVFMATDPVSAPKKPIAQHLYGIIIGLVTIVIRVFAGFPEGISFAILTANTFASLLDEIVPARKKPATGAAAQPAAPAGGAS